MPPWDVPRAVQGAHNIVTSFCHPHALPEEKMAVGTCVSSSEAVHPPSRLSVGAGGSRPVVTPAVSTQTA